MEWLQNQMQDKYFKLVDYHCHLDLFPDVEKIMKESNDSGIDTLAVTTIPRAWPRNRELAAGLTKIRVALGFHPQLTDQYKDDLKYFEKYFNETKYIGEVGLDASKGYYATISTQKNILKRIFQLCNEAGDKIISIHSARASKHVLDLIETELKSGNCKPVLHWFYGTKHEINRAVDLGCYFSVNINMLRNQTGKRVVSQIPLNRILTETDGPFTETFQKPSEPQDVKQCLDEVALILNKSIQEMGLQISCNLKSLEDEID